MKGKPQWLLFTRRKKSAEPYQVHGRFRKLEAALKEERWLKDQPMARHIVLVTVYPVSRQWFFTPRRAAQELDLWENAAEDLIACVQRYVQGRFGGDIEDWTFENPPRFAADLGTWPGMPLLNFDDGDSPN